MDSPIHSGIQDAVVIDRVNKPRIIDLKYGKGMVLTLNKHTTNALRTSVIDDLGFMYEFIW